MPVVVILAASLALQVLAAALAFRLVRVTGARRGWVLIAVGLALMALRRAVTLYRLLAGEPPHPADPGAEWLALGISAVIVGGLAAIRPGFISDRASAGALLRSEERFRSLIDNALDIIAIADADGVIRYVNPAARRILGYEPEELEGHSLFDFAHPDDVPGAGDIFRTVLADPELTPSLDLRLRHANGTWRYVEAMGRSLVDESGGTWVIVQARDITERRRAQEMHARLSAAVEQASETVVITDAEGTIQYVNPAFERVTGYARQEAVGQNPRILKSGKQDDAFYRRMWDTLARGEIWEARFTNRKKDGKPYEADVTISPIRGGEGRIVAYVAVGRDVTERLALERQLQLSQRLEAVGRLAGGIAHDFNNLLTAILGHTQLLADDLPEGDPRRPDLAEIEGAANRAASLTRQLLAFSRRQVIQPRVIDLNAVVAEMEKLLRRLIGEDIELVAQVAPDLGSVRADPAQIEQVLMNLVVNARDAMPEGGRLTIETANVELDEEYVSRHAVATPGSYVMMAVTDTGVGIDAETQAHLFEPFFTTKEKGKGTGLGLATVYGIVKQSGGDVWVYSEPGEGATFKVYLPRVAAPAEPLPPREEPVDPRGTETVLVVEDEDVVREVVRRVLSRQGYTVLEGARSEEALRSAREHPGPIHLLLTDLVMPGMGGRELAERLTALRPGTKVLYMSGYADSRLLERQVLEPGSAFIQKPLSAGGLARRVREVLDAPPGDR